MANAPGQFWSSTTRLEGSDTLRDMRWTSNDSGGSPAAHLHERAVDVAFGDGTVARVTIVHGPTGAVVGVDLDPGMLSVARSTVSTDPWSGVPLQWQEADADKLPFPGGLFDVVCCQLSRQFLADRATALRAAPLEA
jgi:ubiquinone/menaquinone biosynthesis C-methylase UbiE